MTDPSGSSDGGGVVDGSTRLEVRPAGDRALLLTPDAADRLPALARALRQALDDGRLAGVVDLLPAARTLLVTLGEGADAARVKAAVRRAADHLPGPGEATETTGQPLAIPVRYDGDDLEAVARILGVTPDVVIERHTSQVWRCRFVGFTAGFGYLEPAHGSALHLTVPRRHEARTAVPVGAVALADGYTAVYPRLVPGGWQLIGSTTTRVWDIDRQPPSLVRPGTLVQFRCEAP